MTPSGPVWLKHLLNEEVLDQWWGSLDYESKWAVICNTAVTLHGSGVDASMQALTLELMRMKQPMHQDSTGKPIKVGDRVRFRGEGVWTIKAFKPGTGSLGSDGIEFEETLPTSGNWSRWAEPDEIAVDLIVDATGTPPWLCEHGETKYNCRVCVPLEGHEEWCIDTETGKPFTPRGQPDQEEGGNAIP